MITELTPEQEALRQQYPQEYMSIGWSTEPADRETAEAVMLKLYRLWGGKNTPKFVWFDSPIQALRTIKESGKEISSVTPGPDGQLEAPWICYCKFGLELKEDIYSEEDKEKLLLWDQLCRSAGFCYPYTNYFLMVEKPSVAKHDENFLLHCDDGPALQFRDGYSVYAINGIRLPRELGEIVTGHPWDLTLEMIEDTELGEDIRTILQDRWCYEEVDSAGDRVGSGGGRWLKETEAVVVHEDVHVTNKGQHGILRSLLKDKHGRKYLMCSDTSTTRVYCIEVDPSAETCGDAHKSINGGIDDSRIKYMS